ncbi:50S ribosomal protein L25 [Dethiothermospora halolimnae]|uniref:50S ribosomal protein L25 n=1 Tax=Dethiothermospora halolimnae TaxID=3114390 RepID=UPI003CCC31B3
MSTQALKVCNREEKGKKVRKQGFIPAVIYGGNAKGEPIKFNETDFIKVLRTGGERAKIKVSYKDRNQIGIIKEVSRNFINEIEHVDIQLVTENEVVNWEIPINFTGREKLEKKRLVFETEFDQIQVTGKVKDIPETVGFDLSEIDTNKVITIEDLGLSSKIETVKSHNTVLGTVKFVQEMEG